jgi:hypothetical protein
MKTRLTFLCVPALMGIILTSSASAGNIAANAVGNSLGNQRSGILASNICPGSVYCNGEVSGGIDAWTISGFSVSDSFTLAANSTVTGVAYGVWNIAGDSGGSISWNILTGGPDVTAGGTIVASGTTAISGTTDLGINFLGFDVQVDQFNLSQALTAGTYFLELTGATVTSGDPVYWDENDGPLGNGSGSIAWQSSMGYLTNSGGQCPNSTITSGYCGESFAIYANSVTTPEPSTLALGGAGLLLLAGALRRKLNR